MTLISHLYPSWDLPGCWRQAHREYPAWAATDISFSGGGDDLLVTLAVAIHLPSVIRTGYLQEQLEGRRMCATLFQSSGHVMRTSHMASGPGSWENSQNQGPGSSSKATLDDLLPPVRLHTERLSSLQIAPHTGDRELKTVCGGHSRSKPQHHKDRIPRVLHNLRIITNWWFAPSKGASWPGNATIHCKWRI